MKLRCLVLLLGPLLASGCGEDNKTLTPTEFSSRYAQDMCNAISTACMVTETSCMAEQLSQRSQKDQDAVAKGRTFQPSNAQSCLDQVNNVYGKLQQGTVALKASESQSLDLVCKDVYRGGRLANEACNADEDCIMGLICDASKGTPTGRCGAKTEVSAGAGCANIGEVCPTGSYCGNSAGIFVCQPKMDLAMPCSATVPCIESLRCAGGLCLAQLALGEACTADQDCATGFCEPYEKLCAGDLRFAHGTLACSNMAGP
jgi:hypothetical protein